MDVSAKTRWFLNALFPEFCVQCGVEGSVFCSVCREGWVPFPIQTKCIVCTSDTLFGRLCDQCADLIGVEGVFSIGPYRDPVLKGLIRNWKYFSVTKAGEILNELLSRTLQDYPYLLPEVDAIVPIPLHKKRMNERGFDQAEDVARAASGVLNVSLRACLKRRVYTSAQARIDRMQRDEREFERAFVYTGLGDVPERVLLVDDVWTTGTTMKSAAKELRRVGVEKIWALTIARG